MDQDDRKLRELRTLDFFMGLFFAAVGGYMCVASLGMFRDPWLAAVPMPANPGMTTIIIGGLLVLMGAVLVVVGLAASRNPFAQARDSLRQMVRSRAFGKTMVIIGMIAVYFFVLWNNTPYWFSTMLFLIAMMRYFKAGAWWKVVLIAAVCTVVVIYFFGHLAMVLLPDEHGWLEPLYRLPFVGHVFKGLEWFFVELMPFLTGAR